MEKTVNNQYDIQELLIELISVNSVNRTQIDDDSKLTVESGIADIIENLFSPYEVVIEQQKYSGDHENLVITVPGTDNQSALLLTSHADTVPPMNWEQYAFIPRVDNGRIIGLGACDDKGPLAAMAKALLNILRSGLKPRKSIILLVAGDEETNHTGIKHFIKTNKKHIECAIAGEPTGLIPVIAHKGAARWDVVVHGQSAHSSNPHAGRNAICDAGKVINKLESIENELNKKYHSNVLGTSTICVTTIEGGEARNVVPAKCTLGLDVRVLPGCTAEQIRDEIIDSLTEVNATIEHLPAVVLDPPLSTPDNIQFAITTRDICRDLIGHDIDFGYVSYGTDGAYLSSICPTIILGPGNISSAHSVDEFIIIEDLVSAVKVYESIIRSLAFIKD